MINNNPFSLNGKNALITGGSRGLGREMALAFARQGANVAVVSRKVENCKNVCREIEKLGKKSFHMACHIGKWAEVERMFERVINEMGNLDIVINNAGLSPLYPSLKDVSEELFDKVIDINLKGPFRLMALAGSHMQNKNGGSIINISSVASVAPSPGSQPYGAAKAGLNSLTQAFAHEYGPKVRVNAIMAGPFLTDISKAWDMEIFEKRAEIMAMKRGGQPNEIVGAAIYFASQASSFTTGSVLTVDGGWVGGND